MKKIKLDAPKDFRPPREEWPSRGEEPKRVHRKKAPEDLMPAEERAELSRKCGAMNDGTKLAASGKNLGISSMERKAIKHMNESIPVPEGIVATRARNAERAQERAILRHETGKRALDAATRLGQTGFRVRGDIRNGGLDAAKDLGELALVRMTEAMMGRISKDKINAVLKASMAVREEICDPLVKETKLTGALSLEQLVAGAAVKAKALKGSVE